VNVPRIRANGVELAFLTWGPSTGPLALLVHGFPDSPLTWRYLGPALAEDGYRVIAPWTRGYAPSEVPPDRTYTFSQLSGDLNGLHEVFRGDDRAILVGHDWGAMMAYRAAAAAHGRWRRVVGISVPPEPALASAKLSPKQLRRSWYIIAFNLPGAERLLLRGDGDLVRRLWAEWSPGYEATQDDLQPAIDATSTPEGARAALAYYRGLARSIITGGATRPDSAAPFQPTLYIQGSEDGALEPGYAKLVRKRLPEGHAVVLDGLGHWPHLEDPADVNRQIREFLAT
jgi:pimeloyl-ACP methyl ester carboxylesterase